MRKIKARARVDAEKLTGQSLQKIVLSVFAKFHDYAGLDATELLSELEAFGIMTNKSLRLLMKKHRRAILSDEKAKMMRAETLDLLREFNPAGIDANSNTSRFAVSGLVREALEKEFGWDAVVEEVSGSVGICLRRLGIEIEREVMGKVVLDLDQDAVLSMEIIGYSCLAGGKWRAADLEWLKEYVLDIGAYEDDDVVSLRLQTGMNTDQRSEDAVFSFGADGMLVGIRVEGASGV